MKRFVYFFICVLMTISVAAQSQAQSGSFTLEGSNLNHIQDGKLVYQVSGVGNFTISSQSGNISYEETGGWFSKKYELKVPEGNVLWSWASENTEKKIKVTRLFIEGGSQGAGSTVRFEGSNGDWWLQPVFGFKYNSTFMGKAWDNKQMEIITSGITVLKISVDYEIVDCLPTEMISDSEYPEQERYTYAEEIILDRTLAAGWNTICLPFDCHVSELGEGVLAQQFAAYDPEIGLSFSQVEQMSANVPYMIYCPEEIPAQTIVFSGREIYGAAPQPVSYNGMTFIGNYEPGFSMYGKYGVAQNKLLKGGPNAILNGTRAYFEYAEPAAGAMLRINYQPANNNGTTGIETVWSEKTVVPGVYNLQGARVRTENNVKGLPTGIYIVNGRKVVVK